MLPSQLAKSGTESGTQRAVMAWAAIAHIHGFQIAFDWAESGCSIAKGVLSKPVPALKWLHHIPNGGGRGNDARTAAIRGSNLKAEGVRPGVFDLCLPAACRGYHGLYIELKKPGKINDTSKEQKEFQIYLIGANYAAIVCDNWLNACGNIAYYMGYQNEFC